jgi:phage terminase small subunit
MIEEHMKNTRRLRLKAKAIRYEGDETSQGRVKAGTSKGAAQLKRKMFAEEFVKNGFNATHAAIAAGYAPRSAGVTGSRLLKDANVRAAVRLVEKRALQTAGLSTERVLKELERLAFLDPRKLYDSDGCLKPINLLDPDTAAGISSLDIDEIAVGRGPRRKRVGTTTKVRLQDKIAALDRAMRHLGLYERDNRQQSENIAVQVNLVAAPPRKLAAAE